jgi:hypothetical protein
VSEVDDVTITLADATLPPGRWLRGTVAVHARGPVRGLELSVFWVTSGPGWVDEGIVHFQSLDEERAGERMFSFEVLLPITPTTYRGDHFNIDWLVRVRQGSDRVWDVPFQVML